MTIRILKHTEFLMYLKSEHKIKSQTLPRKKGLQKVSYTKGDLEWAYL